MLRIEDLVDWLDARLPAGSTLRYNVMPDDGPTRMAVLNELPGMLGELEDTFDNPVVKIRSRGATADEARDLSHQVDRALMDASPPISFRSLYAVRLARFGGPPWPAGVDRLERTVYECNYALTVSR